MTFYSNYESTQSICSTAKTIEKAIVEIQDVLDTQMIEEVVTASQLKKERIYYHRACEFFSYGENICCECGEVINAKGRDAFIYYLT